MPRFKPKGTLERTATDDLWRHTLSRIPTVFGRFMYLASLRDPNSGIYRHHGLSTSFGRDDSNQALKDSHRRTFREWLKLPLAERSRDLVLYLRDLDDPEIVVVNHWLSSKLYRDQVPSSARKMERELFNQDLEILLETLRNSLAGAGTGQASSPHG
ncbi:MAG: hypothetical protein ABSB35_28560 [Bryobacteraceae bacterium]|jgi:hypothetical protein